MANLPERLNQTQLGRRLGVSRTTVGRYLDMENAPQPDEAGTYEVAGVASFIKANATRVLEGDPIKLLRARKLAAECEKIEAIATQKAVSVADVERFILTYNRSMTQFIYNSMEYELPPKLEGLGVIECRRILQGWSDRFVDYINERIFSAESEALRNLDIAMGGDGDMTKVTT